MTERLDTSAADTVSGSTQTNNRPVLSRTAWILPRLIFWRSASGVVPRARAASARDMRTGSATVTVKSVFGLNNLTHLWLQANPQASRSHGRGGGVGVWATSQARPDDQNASVLPSSGPQAPPHGQPAVVSLEPAASRLGLAGLVLAGNRGYSWCRRAWWFGRTWPFSNY